MHHPPFSHQALQLITDPHSFNLPDLSRPPYVAQRGLPTPQQQQETFGPTSSPFANGTPILPGSSIHYGQPFAQSTMASTSSPLLQHQGLFNPSYQGSNIHVMHSNPSGVPNPSTINQHRLSLSAASRSADQVDPSVNITPPRTAQDLLMRVLGTPHLPTGRTHQSTSPTRAAASSSPETRPAPLLFGTSAGNSIWAP